METQKIEIEDPLPKFLKKKKTVSVKSFYNVSFTEFSYFQEILQRAVNELKASQGS